MPSIRHSSVLLGNDLELVLDSEDTSEDARESVISVELSTDDGDLVASTTFQGVTEIQVPTIGLEPGFYELSVLAADGSMLLAQEVLVASSNFFERLSIFEDALDIYETARLAPARTVVTQFKKVAEKYREVGLGELAQEVDQERRPFDIKAANGMRAVGGTGRRKTASVRATLAPGSGEIVIARKGGDIDYRIYFNSPSHREAVRAPLAAVELNDSFKVTLKCSGGGKTGQAGAARLALSRALLELNPVFRPRLKSLGYLTRDSRSRERKKPGRKGARKRFQFSKR